MSGEIINQDEKIERFKDYVESAMEFSPLEVEFLRSIVQAMKAGDVYPVFDFMDSATDDD